MSPDARAMIAASTYALVTRRKVAGLFDHAADRHLKIATEARGKHLQGYDGDRAVRFGGTLPELYDAGTESFVSVQIEGTTATGFDRGSATAFTAKVSDRLVQLYDHGDSAWFAYDIQVI